MSRSAGSVLADYVFKYLKHRSKRDLGNDFIKVNHADNEVPKLPEEHKHAFHGGERALLYTVLEDFLNNFGLDGHGCVLRTICEVHSKRVERFGLIGEVMRLFFTWVTWKIFRIHGNLSCTFRASLSPFSELLNDYVKAEQMGKEVSECLPYYKRCPKSLFKSSGLSGMSQKDSVTINSGHASM